MNSMTGYGSAQGGSSEYQIDVVIKTLNGRFLEPRFQLPPQYAPFENELKALLQTFIVRGRVDFYIRRRVLASSQLKAIVRTDIAASWIEGYKKLGADLKLLAEPNLDMISRLPDVISFEEGEGVSPKEKKLLFDLTAEALKNCESERSREGKVLQAELMTLSKNLEKKLDQIYKHRHQANQALKKNLLKRLADLGFKNAEKDTRFVQEAALLVEKYDITEEIVRFREHVKVLRELIQSGGAQGKKLDFYTQELLREANTIGSKSQVIKLTELVVDSKALIERIKEQVQNIE